MVAALPADWLQPIGARAILIEPLAVFPFGTFSAPSHRVQQAVASQVGRRLEEVALTGIVHPQALRVERGNLGRARTGRLADVEWAVMGTGIAVDRNDGWGRQEMLLHYNEML